MESTRPSLPLYYFETSSVQLPAELLYLCLLEHAQWGDLARLAAVQSSWKNILSDASSTSPALQWSLAEAFLHGKEGLAKNPKAALKIFHALSGLTVLENGLPSTTNASFNEYSPLAMKAIADYYLPNKHQVGTAWLEAAFETGNHVDAAHDLALIYENGWHGVEVDVVAAVTWFRKAAEREHVEAMAELGLCYELGLAVEQSDETALEWYMKAAEKGHLTAKYSIGEAFEEARGVPQSDAEACLWYYRAAIDGDEDSRRALRRLEDIARIVLPGVGRLLDE